ncbi:MAG: hypothetical protein ACRD5J_15775 [Nitrososphaeraceae archaeon]
MTTDSDSDFETSEELAKRSSTYFDGGPSIVYDRGGRINREGTQGSKVIYITRLVIFGPII